MRFFSRFSRWLGAVAQRKGNQDTRPITSVYKNVQDVGVDGALQISAVWAAVELLSDNIASLPIFVYEQKDGERDLARDSSLWQLMHNRPNSRHTPMEFWQFIVMNFMLRGNAYARLERNAAGEVIAMWPLASDQVYVKVLDDGSLSYEYHLDGSVIVYSEQSVLHFRDKGNGVMGMSRLDYMRSTVGVAINAQNTTNNLYLEENRRAGVFMIDKTLTPDQRTQIRQNFSGLTEAGDDRLLVLESGAKFEPLTMTPADAQLLETRRFSVEDIARWFGIPSILLNDLVNRVPYGNNDDLIQIFYKFKLRPLIVNFEQALNRRILTPRQRASMNIEFSIDAILRGSLKDRVDIYAKQVQNGLKTRNEVRQFENDPPHDDGDELTAQTNLAPLDTLGAVAVGGSVSEEAINQ